LAPGAGEIVVLDASADGRLLVVAHWYGAPPQPYTWPWPNRDPGFQIDRDGHQVEALRAGTSRAEFPEFRPNR